MPHLSPRLPLLALVLLALAIGCGPSAPSAKKHVRTLAMGVVLYRYEHPTQCPDIQELKSELYLDNSQAEVDTWGNAYIVECPEEGDALVVSFGPDGKHGTDDDIIQVADPGELISQPSPDGGK